MIGEELGLAGVATRNLQPWTVYGGVPARVLRKRQHHPMDNEQP